MRAPAVAILAFVVVHLAACGHTSEARRMEIDQEIARTNGDSLTRAYAATLRARGATALPTRAEPLELPHDFERCLSGYSNLTPAPPAEIEIARLGGGKLIAPCTKFADDLRTGIAEAKTEQSKGVLVIRAENAASLATTTEGKILVMRPQLHVVERRVVRIAGTCNRMPIVGPNFMPSENAFVLEGQRRDQIEYVGFAYDGIDEDVQCDDYVY